MIYFGYFCTQKLSGNNFTLKHKDGELINASEVLKYTV